MRLSNRSRRVFARVCVTVSHRASRDQSPRARLVSSKTAVPGRTRPHAPLRSSQAIRARYRRVQKYLLCDARLAVINDERDTIRENAR